MMTILMMALKIQMIWIQIKMAKKKSEQLKCIVCKKGILDTIFCESDKRAFLMTCGHLYMKDKSIKFIPKKDMKIERNRWEFI